MLHNFKTKVLALTALITSLLFPVITFACDADVFGGKCLTDYTEDDGSGSMFLIITLLSIIALWFVFKKAGVKGWKAIIPFYSLYLIVKISKKPISYFWILLVSILGACIGFMAMLFASVYGTTIFAISCFLIFVYSIRILHGLSKAFGFGAWFTLLLVFFKPVGYAYIAFSDAKYKFAPNGESSNTVNTADKSDK